MAYVALGSNLGDRRAHLAAALDAIASLPGVASVQPSGFYETEPVGPQNQGAFLNAAARLQTTLSPKILLGELLTIEHRLGRPPREQRETWGPREIDLDLLLWDNAVIDLPGLTLPHPRLAERWFVLRPLLDVAAGVVHPTLNRTIRELLDAVTPPPLSPKPVGGER